MDPTTKTRLRVGGVVALAVAVAIAALAWRSADPEGARSAPPQEYVPFGPEVPYVPTREDVLDEMLRLAMVTKDDLLYDLGCGDGRIVITAAKRFGTRGVGVDIDPRRIEESNENARKAGVTKLVKFVEGDLFDTDLSRATVVTLYLLPDVNMRLRPKLLKELKPGARVVSHNYHMGDWKPTKETRLDDHFVYFWVIPEKGGAPPR